MSKLGIISLGCPRNLVDSERLLAKFKEDGNTIVDIDKAEIAVVNTCSFIEDARRESVDTILELIQLKKEGRIKKVVVAGCLVELYKDELDADLKEVDSFISITELRKITRPESVIQLTPPHYRYIKIQEGCGNKCNFCIIPKIKGQLTSRPVESIIKEVRALPQEVSEINIVGQDISLYGVDLYGELKLADLIEKIAGLKKIPWIRLLYANPANINKKLINLFKKEQSICKYLDLPIQHINDNILKRMQRGISKRQIIDVIEKLRNSIPGLAIRTSIIVGYPGEIQSQFEELLDFIKKMRFERLGVFTYSREENTQAGGFKNQIPEKIKIARYNEIMRVQQEISKEINASFIGKEVTVLIDEVVKDQPGCFLGRTEHDAPEVDGQVWVKTKSAKPGDFIKIKITDTLEYDLVGEEV